MLKNLKAFFGRYHATEVEINRVNLAISANVTEHSSHNQATQDSLKFAATQAGTYLTHVSMMIAVTGVFLATEDKGQLFDLVLTFELTGYLVLALLAIRCQFRINKVASDFAIEGDAMVGGARIEEETYHRLQKEELVYRDKLLRVLMWAIYSLTAILIVTLLVSSLHNKIPDLSSFISCNCSFGRD